MIDFKLHVLDIIGGTTVDGVGLRTSIYLAGCRHQCHNCHNPHSWDPETGVLMSIDDIMQRVLEEDFNVTITGGDPLFNPSMVAVLCKRIHDAGYNIWLYTGYTWEEILLSDKLRNAIQNVDYIVDGRFVENLKDPKLKFRGSSNQRIINVKKSILSGVAVCDI